MKPHVLRSALIVTLLAIIMEGSAGAVKTTRKSPASVLLCDRTCHRGLLYSLQYRDTAVAQWLQTYIRVPVG